MKKLIYLVIISIVISSCGNEIPEPGEWQDLGFEDKLVGKLHIIDNELYACAGRDGLFRKSLKKYNAKWKYLGLADTTENRTIEIGLTDVVKINDELLVSYLESYKQEKCGVYRSVDDGENWTPSDSGMFIINGFITTSQVIRLKQHPAIPEIIFAGTSMSVIYKSEDGGKSWSKVYGELGTGALNYAIEFTPDNYDNIWVGCESGYFYPYLINSENMGNTWSDMIGFPQNIGPYSFDNAVYDIQISPQNDSIMYFGMLGLIAKSIDKGQTFRRVLGWEDGIYMNWRIEINPEDPTELFSTGCYLYHSIDSGETWDKITPPDDRDALYALEVDWGKRILYVSTSSPGNGIYNYSF